MNVEGAVWSELKDAPADEEFKREKIMSEINLREMTEKDCAQVCNLLDELGHPADEEEVLQRFKRLKRNGSGSQIVAVSTDGEVIGLCAVSFAPVIHRQLDVGRITTLIVSRLYRKLGIGQKLVVHAEKIMTSNGSRRIEVASANERQQAHNFYESLGYLREGIRFTKTL